MARGVASLVLAGLLALTALEAQRPAAALRATVPAPAACVSGDPTGILLYFLDIGQGDAALLRAPDGRYLMIDAGPDRGTALRWLRTLGVDSLALIIGSHNHLDHIGGFPAILQAMPVRNAMENGMVTTTRIYRDFVYALERRGTTLLEASPRTLRIGGLEVEVLPPWRQAKEQNDASIGVVVRHGAFRALFTGDAELEALGHWTRAGAIPRVQVVKVGHHGSRNATTAALVRATRPALAVISVGAGNSYQHPHPEALALWQAPERTILRTDQAGTIALRGCADGSFHLTTQRGSGP
ncbi:MAG: ComEC/Rec2 family competence protein [Gemmatimonadaceae bacterium]